MAASVNLEDALIQSKLGKVAGTKKDLGLEWMRWPFVFVLGDNSSLS